MKKNKKLDADHVINLIAEILNLTDKMADSGLTQSQIIAVLEGLKSTILEKGGKNGKNK